MHFLIDGHNLIGSNLFNDIRLSDVDDEAKLVRQLKVWQSRQRRPGGSMTVIFDRGIPGGIDVKMGGSGVQVIFAADPAQADDLIRRRLRQAKKDLVLVTNDDALIQLARAYGVRRWRGEEFIQRMRLPTPEVPEAGTEEDVQVSKQEVEEWLALFRARHAARMAKRRAKRNATSSNGAQKPPAKPVTKRDPARGNDQARAKGASKQRGKERRGGKRKG